MLTCRMVVGLGEASFVSLASPLIGNARLQCQLSCISCIAQRQPSIHDCRPAMKKRSVLLKAEVPHLPRYSSAAQHCLAALKCGVLISTSQHCQRCSSVRACCVKDLLDPLVARSVRYCSETTNITLCCQHVMKQCHYCR